MTSPSPDQLWRRYHEHLWRSSKLGISLDISRMRFDDGFFERMRPAMRQAFEEMTDLEAGAIANPDEQRMVGHYWLRAPELAPTSEIQRDIRAVVQNIHDFARRVHNKKITPPADASARGRFTDLLLIGIGGSALGPQLLADALAQGRNKLRPHFLDNTDPQGVHRTIDALGARLKSTLVLVVSKSGTTPETHNGMVETRDAFHKAGLDFPAHALAITGPGSELDRLAEQQGWLARLPMWDWVGGRTSVTSAVGLVPAALLGVDIDALLRGAAEMDELTRAQKVQRNPAARLALMWHWATGGRGEKDMVMLPYKDRLVLLSRYLQQLVMESLGKAKNREGRVVHQGIAVYGNKGSTDQHAYVQQLRDGVNNFFANFIVVLQDESGRRHKTAVEVSDHATSGDFLSGFWQGTRKALHDNGRESLTITLDRLDPRRLGALIALYERAVGFYATLVNINAYHQPGVEAGKKAAAAVLELQEAIVRHLREHPDDAFTPEQLAEALETPDQAETVEHILAHLAANKRHAQRKRATYQYLPAM